MNISNSRDKLLDHAKRIFLTKGYNAASVSEICKKASISKGGFYHLFKSKEQLAMEVLDRFYLKHVSLLSEGYYTDDPDPLIKVLSYLDHAKIVADRIWGDGCLLMVFSTDISGSNSSLGKKVQGLFEDFIIKTSDVFIPLFGSKTDYDGIDSYALAERFVAQLEGYIILSRVFQDSRFIEKGIEDFKEYVINLAKNNRKEALAMPRYVIERDIPEIGSADREKLREASGKSNSVLAEMKKEGKHIQWDHSYVVNDKTFCIYIADNEDLIFEHAKRSGFPATRVSQVRKVIDPVTAEES